jgi:hypothetical protein
MLPIQYWKNFSQTRMLDFPHGPGDILRTGRLFSRCTIYFCIYLSLVGGDKSPVIAPQELCLFCLAEHDGDAGRIGDGQMVIVELPAVYEKSPGRNCRSLAGGR